MSEPPHSAAVDENGRLILPPHVMESLGIAPGSRVLLRGERDGVRIGRSASRLDRLYLEPTTACNLACRMCMHESWDEPVGSMSRETFARIMQGLRALPRKPLLFFGGYGEPLLHPDIRTMLSESKAAGFAVEMITNGTLLSDEICGKLIDIGLDRLWISVDGTGDDPADAGQAEVGRVTENAGRLFRARERELTDLPRIGISFVATRETIGSLPSILRLGRRLGADRFIVSNVLAHTPELHAQSLYERSFYETELSPSEWTPLVELPRMEVDSLTEAPLIEVLKGLFAVRIAGQDLHLGSSRCPFVERGSMAVRWDGTVSPCLPLLHSHTSFLADRERRTLAFGVGNLTEKSVGEIWDEPSYLALRERLLAFDFPPCTLCNSCEHADSNESDCFANPTPACGGCLWAQGYIQCP
jgi:MoaA/NifB/PqqE/SkfB family radical SAM enzyme